MNVNGCERESTLLAELFASCLVSLSYLLMRLVDQNRSESHAFTSNQIEIGSSGFGGD